MTIYISYCSAWLRPKVNTKVTVNHHPPPPPTTNFLKGSRLHRRLRFDMQAFLVLRVITPTPFPSYSNPHINPPHLTLSLGGNWKLKGLNLKSFQAEHFRLESCNCNNGIEECGDAVVKRFWGDRVNISDFSFKHCFLLLMKKIIQQS